MSPYLTPTSALPNEVREILASTFYVENWYLALNSADYLNHSGDPTTVQHYWSLSLEEQFYVMWPLLMLLAAWIGVKWFRGARRRAVITTLAVVSVLSFVFCVVFTMTNPAPAYFVTFGRMWQFGVGAMVALVPMLRIRNAIGSFVLGWAGVAVLVFTIFRFDGQTPFPGYAAALPTLGAAAVIMASNHERWWYPTRVLAIRPAQFVGDISYSLYLWHWPLIIIAPYMLGRPLDLPWSLTILAGTLVLAELTHRFVEDPVRWAPFLTTRSPAVTFGVLFAAAAVALIPAVGGLATLELEKREDARIIAASDGLECFGADAVGPDGTLCQPPGLAKVVPGPGVATDDVPSVYNDRCRVETDEPGVKECVISDADGDVRIAAVGDSHLAQWVTPLADLGVERGWHVTLFFKAACPFSAAADSVRTAESDPATCADWNESVEERLLKGGFDGVITSASAQYVFDGGSSAESATAGYRERWQVLTSSGMPVAVLSDSPQVPQATIDCVGDVANPASDCGWPAGRATARTHVLEDAARGLSDVEYVDLTDHFCVSGTCPAVVGSVLVYRDESSHVTDTYARTLLPHLEMALKHFAASVR